jgi:tetratricopeptide (TPR) repeat protein
MLVMWQGDLDRGMEMIKECAYMAQVIEDDLAMGLSFMGSGVVLLNRGDAAGAFPLLEQSLEIFKEIKLGFFEANTMIHLGNSSLALGDIPAARGHLEQALPLAKQVGDNWLIASILNNMGEVARVEGDYPLAQKNYEQSEALFRGGEDIEDQNRLAHSLGYIALYQGDAAKAEQLFDKSMTIFRELGIRRGIAECLAGFARLALVRGKPEAAARLLGAATAEMRACHADWWPADQVEVRASLSGIRAALGEEEFETALQAGQKLSVEQALELEASLR